MPNKLNLIQAGAFALVIACDIKLRIKAKKAAESYLSAYIAFEEIQRANEGRIEYLTNMLNKNDIPVDEFDLIALNYHNQ